MLKIRKKDTKVSGVKEKINEHVENRKVRKIMRIATFFLQQKLEWKTKMQTVVL